MTTRARLLPTALLTAAVVLGVVGCGVDTNDDVATGTSDSVTLPEAPTLDTEPEASTTTTEADDDETTTTEADDDDGTTTTEAELSVPTLPPGVDEDVIRDQLATSFETLGLTPTESTCLADAYLREFGATTTSPDYSKMFDLFTECDIDPTSLGE